MTPTPPAPKQAEALTFGMEKVPAMPVVAWSYVPSEVWKDTVLTDAPGLAQLARDMGCDVHDLVRLTDAQSALLAQAAEKDAEIERLRADAERLNYLQSRGATVELVALGPALKFRIGGIQSTVNSDIRTAIDSARALANQEAKS